MSGEAGSSLGARVEEVLASARQAAAQLQREVEEASAQRAIEVRLEAENDALRLRSQAVDEARRYLEDARRRVDAFADARIRRITELTDALAEAAANLPERMAEAVAVRRQIDELIIALGAAAEQAAREADRPAIDLPRVGEPPPGPAHATDPAPETEAPEAEPS